MASNTAMNHEDDNRMVRIVLQGQDNQSVYFRIKYNAPLSKLGERFAILAGISEHGIRLIYDGQRIGANDTAKSMGLEDNDIVEVYQEQLSG